jgi:Lipopolysaccharide-assembly
MIKMTARKHLLLIGGSLLLFGCGTYRVTSSVPAKLRTISVPVFENKTGFPEFGAIATQHTLREIQREGSLKITSLETASLKLLCSVSNEKKALSFNRAYGTRASEYRYTMVASVTLVERSTGKFLMDNVPVEATTTFSTYDDLFTSMQSAAPRVSEELARNIVDTILALWTPKKEEPPAPPPVLPEVTPEPKVTPPPAIPETKVATPEPVPEPKVTPPAVVPETKAVAVPVAVPETTAVAVPVAVPETKVALPEPKATVPEAVPVPKVTPPEPTPSLTNAVPAPALLLQSPPPEPPTILTLPQDPDEQFKPRKYR